ncbi:MAG: ATP-dependent helicase, partial [Chitinophagales bacterium]
EEALRRLNIPYKIYGGLSFYQRKEIKDLIGYLKLVVNPREEESLRRVINYPKRGIGNTTIAKIALIANEEEKTMWQIMENIHEQNLPARAKTLIEDFVVMVKSFQLMLQEKNAYDVAFHIAKTTRILGELYADKTIEGISRYENIQELLNGIKEFSVEDVVEEGEEGNEDRSLGAYLQNITLLTDQDKNDEDMESVKMMTVHAAKGLEFPVVFVVGLEENLFPSAMSMYTREDLEEERRLFYVAITRAESHLYISFANTRYKFGSLQFCEPSRFLRELPKETIQFFGQKESKPSSSTSSTPTRKSESGLNLTRKPQKTTLIRKKSTGSMPSMKNFKASDNNLLQEGMEVIHQKFGKGKIKTISGTNITNKMAMISFEAVGERKLMLKFAKLQIV